MHERFAPFLDGGGFQPQLLVQNLTATAGVIVTPEIILEDGRFYLKPLEMGPHSTATLDLHAALVAHGSSAKRGTVAIRYKMNSYGGITSAVESGDWSHHLYLLSYGQSGEEYWAGTAYEAALWAPDDGTDGFVTLTNTTGKPKTVEATFIVDGESKNVTPIEISPRQTYWLKIDDLVRRSRKNGAGIHLEVLGHPGDVVVEGALLNRQTGFAKYIHFMDKALKFPTGTLRSHLVLLGQQAAEDNYPPEVSFRSVAVVRNIDQTTVGVTPTIKYLLNGSVQSVALTPVTLNVGESRVIDFSREQKEGVLPGDLHQATLELAPDTGNISIVAELFNFDRNTGGYVVGPSFVSYPSKGSSSIWRIDGSYQTTVMVENTASQEDQVTLKLYSDANVGAGPYEKVFPIAAGGILKINVRELQQDRVADKDGNLLSVNSGVMSISGSHGPQSRLSLDKVIHSADVADYVGLPNFPCDYVTAVDIVLSGSQNPYTVLFDYAWVQAGEDYEPGSLTSSSNTNWVQITHAQGGDLATVTPVDGQTHTAFISAPPVSAQSCDACSGDTFVAGEAQVHVPAVTPRIIFNGADITGTTQSVVVGQQIALAASYTLSPSVTVNSQSWMVPGTRVGGFTMAPDFSNGQVVATDFTHQSTTFYWTVGTATTQTVTFTLNYGSNKTATASANFNIAAPSAVSVTVPPLGVWQINSSTSGFELDFGFPIDPDEGIKFNGHAVSPSGHQGTYFWVQVVGSDQTTFTSGSTLTCSFGSGLDNLFPYGGTNGLTAEDSPALGLPTGDSKVTRANTFTMYFMWRPGLANDIPVPLGYITWRIFGDAVQSSGTWTVQADSSRSADPFQASPSFPTWFAKLTNGTPENCH